jgi:hypothetical protein
MSEGMVSGTCQAPWDYLHSCHQSAQDRHHRAGVFCYVLWGWSHCVSQLFVTVIKYLIKTTQSGEDLFGLMVSEAAVHGHSEPSVWASEARLRVECSWWGKATHLPDDQVGEREKGTHRDRDEREREREREREYSLRTTLPVIYFLQLGPPPNFHPLPVTIKLWIHQWGQSPCDPITSPNPHLWTLHWRPSLQHKFFWGHFITKPQHTHLEK